MRKVLPLLLMAGLGALAILMFVAPWQAWRFDYSALGNKGLELMLQSHNIAVRRSVPHETPMASDLALRLMTFPYFGSSFIQRDDKIPQMDQERFIDKIYEIPSLVVLPKWNALLLQHKRADDSMLLSSYQLNKNMALVIDDLRLIRLNKGFTHARVSLEAPSSLSPPPVSHEISLYQAQLFAADSIPDFCQNILSIPQGSLLISCNADLYFLSDPDLLNNHGLALGEHAALAVAMIDMLRGPDETRPVYFDNNSDLLKEEGDEEQGGQDYERGADDLARMLDYPLSIIWGMMLLVVMVSLWRGCYRFGAAQNDVSSRQELSKAATVAATARLLRLSRNDRPMVAQFVHTLLLDKAAQRFGPQAGNEAGIERLLQQFERRDKTKARTCRALIQHLTAETSHATTKDLRQNLKLFQNIIKEF